MATWGPYSTSNQYIKYQIVLTEGGVSGRSRLVNVKVQAWRTNSGYTTDGDGTVYVTINGGSYSNSWVYGALPITQNSYTTFFNQDVYVGCDNAGNGTISVSAYFSHKQFTSSSQGSSMNVTNIGAATASFNLNVLLPDGSEPYTTGAAGSLEFSSNGGSSYSRVYNEPASSYVIGTNFRFRNFTPGTGLYLSSVSGASASGSEYVATLGSSGLTVNFQTAWTQYPLQINPNGGYRVSDGNTSTITTIKTYGQTEAISGCVRDNYILAGYTLTNSSNGSTTDLGGASFTFDSATKTGTFTQGTVACTLTANWVLDAYVITYDDNGGSNGPGSTAIEVGSSGTVATTIPTRQGYTFVGWAPGIETSPIRIQPGDSFTPTGDITFYAIWEEWTYSVIFDANGGYGSLPSNYSDIPGYVSIGIGDEKPSSVGGIFLNWNTKADGTGITYNSGDMIALPQTSSTITIYAMYYSTDIYFNSDCSIECIEFIEDSTCNEPYLEPTGKMFAQEFIEHDGDIMFEGGIVYAKSFIEKQIGTELLQGKHPTITHIVLDKNNNVLVN